MKYFLISMMIIGLMACGSSKPDPESEKEYKVTVTQNFSADTVNSVITWVRDVENKVVNKEIKIFGSTATVNMENVKFSSNGDMPLIDGKMVLINDSLTNISLTVSFTMVRLYSNNSNEAISTEKFPPSLMEITSIVPDTIENQYNLEGELTIKDKTGPVSFPATIYQDSIGNYMLNGICKLQTLNWPIREEADPANINYDIISLSMNVIFQEGEIIRDSVEVK
jgi:polyisoprenoid-binding protein YceI